ncbi:MAG: hypothetical protein H6815_00445 [Phycisphaeraceae bacterium]|nr:hypothetical protein [Phycisphaerales bacterium]MCB9858893.1 hypothetical protein [Phycisphaeraceae bacterium]
MNTYLDTTITLDELRIRVAEAAGLSYYGANADSAAQVNVDEQQIDSIDRAIDDGLHMFYSYTNPAARFMLWSFLRPTVSINISSDATAPNCIDADASKYRLPPIIQSWPVGNWGWAGENNLGGELTTTSLQSVARMHANNPSLTGYPQMIAMGPDVAGVNVGDNVRSFQLRVFPKPDVTYTLSAEFRVQPSRLRNPDEKHIAGAMNDAAVIAACVYCGVKEHGPSEDIDRRKAEYDELVVLAAINDVRNGPKTLGVMGDADMPRIQTVTRSSTYPTNTPLADIDGVPVSYV